MKKFITLMILSIIISGCSKYTTKRNDLGNIKGTENGSAAQEPDPQMKNYGVIAREGGTFNYLDRYEIKKIAVLLPPDNAFRNISVAIRDGIISSWYDNSYPQFQPELLFLSTSSPIKEIAEKIEEENIDFVIGPLRKGLISKIKKQLPHRVGMLALNTDLSFIGEGGSLYQFALSPENEAIQVAQKARSIGQRMLLIFPTSDWGTRISKTYRETWRDLGGVIVSEIPFNPNESDYSGLVKRALNIDRSVARKNLIRSLLETKIQFEFRRRTDIDTIILAANEAQARQILPQLRFHRAENIPIFSSSHVFSDVNIQVNNKDLEGLIFGDAPWITAEEDFFLRKTLQDTSHPAIEYPRLFAFGRDAYNILPFLKKMERTPSIRLPGATGNLWVNTDNVIQRDLKWHRFKNGKARRESSRSY